jgi:SPP1 family predicted phage head-tail adaptor
VIRNAPHLIEIYRIELIPDGMGGFVEDRVLKGTVRGRIGVIEGEDVRIAQQVGSEITASARVPHSTDVKTADELELNDGPHDVMAGPWRIDAIRWNPDHLRLMLSHKS